jgi:hypothetical protein
LKKPPAKPIAVSKPLATTIEITRPIDVSNYRKGTRVSLHFCSFRRPPKSPEMQIQSKPL